MNSSDPVRIFVGTDRSQMLGVKVLEYSTRRHTDLTVEVIPMLDLELPVPKDPRNRQRTGFSFSRFAIPQLAGYKGRAIYTDADMQVFQDIAEIWKMPFNGTKLICQEELPDHIAKMSKTAAPSNRTKQCSVMVLDCGALTWDPVEIVNGLNHSYNYAELMQQLCILDEAEVSYDLPVRWNSLEHFDEDTCLIHYTDMPTQPWVNIDNPNGWLFTNEIRRMLKDRIIEREELVGEISLGYVRPSFITELKMVSDSRDLTAEQIHQLSREDKKKGFVPHRELNEMRRQFKLEIRDFEKKNAEATTQQNPITAAAKSIIGGFNNARR